MRLLGVEQRRGLLFDSAFHVVFVGVALTNLYVFYLDTQLSEPVVRARTESWWSLVLVALWLLPSVFYVRTWASAATDTTLWKRYPVVQFIGIPWLQVVLLRRSCDCSAQASF